MTTTQLVKRLDNCSKLLNSVVGRLSIYNDHNIVTAHGTTIDVGVGYAVCCGWNTMGIGLTRGFIMVSVLMVTHGGAHNDTLVTVECKTPQNPATETLGTTRALTDSTQSEESQ